MAGGRPFRGRARVPHVMGNHGCVRFAVIRAGRGKNTVLLPGRFVGFLWQVSVAQLRPSAHTYPVWRSSDHLPGSHNTYSYAGSIFTQSNRRRVHGKVIQQLYFIKFLRLLYLFSDEDSFLLSRVDPCVALACCSWFQEAIVLCLLLCRAS